MKSAVFGLPSIQPVVAAWKGVGGWVVVVSGSGFGGKGVGVGVGKLTSYKGWLFKLALTIEKNTIHLTDYAN